MAENIHAINLLPNKGGSLMDQFLAWALTVGRLLIILTETLALGTFLYRFSIDMRIIDLRDLIKNQSIIVANFKNTEETARDLQARLAFAQTYIAETDTAPSIFSDIIEMGRGKVTFRNLSISNASVKIAIQAPSAGLLNGFINQLKTHPAVTSVNISSVENMTSSAVVRMDITAGLNQASTDQSALPAIGIPGGPVNTTP
jgi:hypothetical protein